MLFAQSLNFVLTRSIDDFEIQTKQRREEETNASKPVVPNNIIEVSYPGRAPLGGAMFSIVVPPPIPVTRDTIIVPPAPLSEGLTNEQSLLNYIETLASKTNVFPLKQLADWDDWDKWLSKFKRENGLHSDDVFNATRTQLLEYLKYRTSEMSNATEQSQSQTQVDYEMESESESEDEEAHIHVDDLTANVNKPDEIFDEREIYEIQSESESEGQMQVDDPIANVNKPAEIFNEAEIYEMEPVLQSSPLEETTTWVSIDNKKSLNYSHLMMHEIADTLHDFTNSKRCPLSDNKLVTKSLKSIYKTHFTNYSHQTALRRSNGADSEAKFANILIQQNPQMIDIKSDFSRIDPSDNFKNYLGLTNNKFMGILYDACQSRVDDVFSAPLNPKPNGNCLNIGTIAGEWDEASKSKYQKLMVRIRPTNAEAIEEPLHVRDSNTHLHQLIYFVFTQTRNYVLLKGIGDDNKVQFDFSVLKKNIVHLSVKSLCEILEYVQQEKKDNKIPIQYIDSLLNDSLAKYDIKYVETLVKDGVIKNYKSYRQYLVDGLQKVFDSFGSDQSSLIFDIKRSLDYGQVVMADYLRNNKGSYELIFQPTFKNDSPSVHEEIQKQINKCSDFGIITSDKLCYLKAKLHNVPAIKASSQEFICDIYGQEVDTVELINAFKKRASSLYSLITKLKHEFVKQKTLVNAHKFITSLQSSLKITLNSSLDNVLTILNGSKIRESILPQYEKCHIPLLAVQQVFSNISNKMCAFINHLNERMHAILMERDGVKTLILRMVKEKTSQWEADSNLARLVQLSSLLCTRLYSDSNIDSITGLDRRNDPVLRCALSIAIDVINDLQKMLDIVNFALLASNIDAMNNHLLEKFHVNHQKNQVVKRVDALSTKLNGILNSVELPQFELDVQSTTLDNRNLIQPCTVKYHDERTSYENVHAKVVEYHMANRATKTKPKVHNYSNIRTFVSNLNTYLKSVRFNEDQHEQLRFLDCLLQLFKHAGSSEATREMKDCIKLYQSAQSMEDSILKKTNGTYKAGDIFLLRHLPNDPVIKYICHCLNVSLDDYDNLLRYYLYEKDVQGGQYKITTENPLDGMKPFATYVCPYSRLEKCYSSLLNFTRDNNKIVVGDNISEERILNIIQTEYKNLLSDVLSTFRTVSEAMDKLVFALSSNIFKLNDIEPSVVHEKLTEVMHMRLKLSATDRLQHMLVMQAKQDKQFESYQNPKQQITFVSNRIQITLAPLTDHQIYQIHPSFYEFELVNEGNIKKLGIVCEREAWVGNCTVEYSNTSKTEENVSWGIQRLKRVYDIFDARALTFQLNENDISKDDMEAIAATENEWKFYSERYLNAPPISFNHYGKQAVFSYQPMLVNSIKDDLNHLDITITPVGTTQHVDQTTLRLIKVYARIPQKYNVHGRLTPITRTFPDEYQPHLTDISKKETHIQLIRRFEENDVEGQLHVDVSSGIANLSLPQEATCFNLNVFSPLYVVKCIDNKNQVKFILIDLLETRRNDPNNDFQGLYDIISTYDLSCCEICGEFDMENDMIMCDNIDCNRAYHMRCLKMVKSQGQWFCPVCINDSLSSLPLTCNTCKKNVNKRTEQWSVCSFYRKNSKDKKWSSGICPVHTFYDDDYGYTRNIDNARTCQTVVYHSPCKKQTKKLAKYCCDEHTFTSNKNKRKELQRREVEIINTKRTKKGGGVEDDLDALAIEPPVFHFTTSTDITEEPELLYESVKYHVISDLLNFHFQLKRDESGVIYTDEYTDIYEEEDFQTIVNEVVEYVLTTKPLKGYFEDPDFNTRALEYIRHLDSIQQSQIPTMSTFSMMPPKPISTDRPSVNIPSTQPNKNGPAAAAGGSKYSSYSFFSDSLRSSLYKRMVRQLALKGGMSRKQLKGKGTKGNKHTCSFIDETFF